MDDSFASKHLCGHAEVQSYTGAVNLVAPPHMAEAYPRGICVDVCLALEITKLWADGITTTGCCCGHGSHPAYIGVIEGDIQSMKAMGYAVAPNPMRPGDDDSFVPKTVLAASPSPSEMEVVPSDLVERLRATRKAISYGVDAVEVDVAPSMLDLEAADAIELTQSALAAMRADNQDLLAAADADAFAIDNLQTQVLRLTEENEALRRVLGNAEKALSAAERWIEAEFPNSEIELNGALSNVHAEVSNTAYDARTALKENAL